MIKGSCAGCGVGGRGSRSGGNGDSEGICGGVGVDVNICVFDFLIGGVIVQCLMLLRLVVCSVGSVFLCAN